ncbi:hypothetical protein FLCU109888_11785 [Flavobacterium cucumis]|uniref:Lipoprotein n=1 Tax=Flavobacterium cucumis TaxID=416016 RepID=A0A1M7ZWQ6_9FLAO|nr:hypothetical protein [Flavobacterium cucumis]SHO73286.1 hypothetical protein SAMN05443547_1642 [Flavobacterium cucumis]
MNIQQVKKLTNFIFLLSIILFFTGCNAQNKIVFIEILTGVEVQNNIYDYSEESFFILNDIKYSLRSKAKYDINGDIQQLMVYKSDGILIYEKNQLLENKDLISYYNVPAHQNFSYLNEGLLISNNEKIKVVSIGDYIIKKNKKIIYFYRLK